MKTYCYWARLNQRRDKDEGEKERMNCGRNGSRKRGGSVRAGHP